MSDIRLQAKRDVVKIPLYSTEEAYMNVKSPTTGSEMNRQVLVNMFPVINKDPIRDDGGEVALLTRPGFGNPVTTNSDLTDHLTLDDTEPMAVLSMRGTPSECLVVAYADYSNPTYYVRIIQYRPGVSPNGCILMGTINLTAYGYTSHGDCTVNLTEITHGTSSTVIVPGVAITIHPTAALSTSANSDAFYALTTSGYFTSGCIPNVAGIASGIADTDFPTNTPARGITGPIVQLNNVHYVMTNDGFIYGSYPSDTGPNFMPDITTWNALGVTTASQDADRGVAIVRYKHHLIAFGTATMEFFNDEGLAKPNLPIQRTQQAYLRIGLANNKSYCHVDDDLYFIGSSQDTSSIGLYKLSGYTPELLSSVPINHLMSPYGRYDPELYPFYTMGTTHIITNIAVAPGINGSSIMGADEPDNNEFKGTLVYCINSKAWWVLAFEFTDYLSDIISRGNGLVPQIRIAVSLIGTQMKRWVWVCGYQNDASPEDIGMHPIQMYQDIEADGGTALYDKFRVSNTSTTLTYRIPTAFRTNRLQFSSLNRKTIHKLKLQRKDIYDAQSTSFLPAEEWKLYFSFWKDIESDSLGADAGQVAPNITRTIDLELPAYNPFLTMYNFGTCRSVMIQMLSNNAYPIELGHLEATLTLADH